MKLQCFLSWTIAIFSLALFACDNGDNPKNVNCNRFYRLENFDTGITLKSNKVRVLFQVKGCENEGISGLTVDDFEVIENGFSMDTEADITVDPGQIPFSVKTVLLLDITRSVEGLVGQIKEASISLINQKIPNQEFAVYEFDKNLRIIQDFTSDTDLLVNAINSIPETGLQASTNLYGSLIDLNIKDMWEDVFTVDSIAAGNLILFTDGRHNANQTQSLEDALASIGNQTVYVAALQSPDLVEEPLQQIGASGGYVQAENITRLEAAFLEIQKEIVNLSGSIYYLFYTSPISDPTPIDNELIIRVFGNTNSEVDNEIVTSFNSEGFN